MASVFVGLLTGQFAPGPPYGKKNIEHRNGSATGKGHRAGGGYLYTLPACHKAWVLATANCVAACCGWSHAERDTAALGPCGWRWKTI